jgi:molybdopterin converting factor subunit 1
MSSPTKTISVQYFALLREERGCSSEQLETDVPTALALYRELQLRHGFRLEPERLRVAINEEFKAWDTPLQPGDEVVFIPPVSGG